MKQIKAKTGKSNSTRVNRSTVSPPNRPISGDPGLSDLRNAIWDDRELRGLRETPAEISVGLDCLRYAVWTPGETSAKGRLKFVDSSSQKDSGRLDMVFSGQ